MEIIADHTRCDGCRLCELICSLRLCGEFDPARSAVRISKNEKKGIYVPVISPFSGLLLDRGGKPIKCDLCDGTPRCVEICTSQAIRIAGR